MRKQLLEGTLTDSVIAAFYEVYNHLGFGFLERIHCAALERELRAKGHSVGREVSIPIFYKGDQLGIQRIDMIVDERLVVEVKSCLQLPPNATQQLYNYLRATNIEVGLLLHFGDEPKFYRKVARLSQKRDPLYPVHPVNP